MGRTLFRGAPYFLILLYPFDLLFYFWLCWVSVPVHGLSLLAVSWGFSSLRYTGFSEALLSLVS